MKAVPCSLCGSWKSHTIDYVPQYTVNLGGTQFVRDITNVICEDDGLIYQNPRLEANEREEMYTAMARLMQLSRHAIQPAAPPPADELENEQFEFVGNSLGGRNMAGLKVMEIGCSVGRFLRLFHEAGAAVYGVEPSESDAEYAEKVNNVRVSRDFFKSDLFPPDFFNLVIMLYVFEHIEDPLSTLNGIRSQLKPQGLLFLEVPDSTRPFVGLDPFFTLEHLFSYTPGTLRNFLNKAGFEVVQLDQIGGVENTGKNFARLRVLARKVANRSTSIDYGDEFTRTLKIMNAYREDRQKLIERINNLLTPLIQRWVRSEDRVVIYGAGTHSSELLKHTALRQVNLIGFVDSNPTFQGNSYLGLPVHSPDSLNQLKPDVVVISARGWETQIWEILAPHRAREVEVITLYRTEMMAGEGGTQ